MADDRISSILQSTSTAASLTTASLLSGRFTPIVPSRPAIEIAPPDHPIYSLIGRAASAWAHLEHTLDLIIWDLSGVSEERTACITAQILGATNRYRAIIALLKQRGWPSHASRAEALMRKTFDPTEQRNRIIHDPWYLYDTKEAQFRAMPQKDPRFGVCAVDTADIEKFLGIAEELAKSASQLRIDIKSALGT